MQFVQFQTLFNCVTNDFLKHGHSPYGTPPPFPHPTTLGDPSTPCANSSQVILTFVLKSESRLLNDSIFVVLQGSQSSQAPMTLWGGSFAAGGPSTWPPPPLASL
jgi:hypothetical protein